MKKIFLIILLTNIVPFEKISASSLPTQDRLVRYNGAIEHIFFHPLVIYPENAYNNESRKSYIGSWFVTLSEFRSIIGELFSRGYIIVSLRDLYEIRGGVPVKKELYLPAGKRPLVLGVDDLNFYESMTSHGVAKRLALYRGKLFSVIDTHNGEKYYESVEVVTVLDRFVKENPSFSWNGAKGIIALTGYKGVFGYNTVKKDGKIDFREVSKAKEIADYVKGQGWMFASHGYAHIEEGHAGPEKNEADAQRWNEEVLPVTGPTDIHVYPYGDSIKEGSSSFEVYLRRGFHFFFGVDFATTWKNQGNYVCGARIPIDGRYINGVVWGSRTSQFFNISKVIDPLRVLFFQHAVPEKKQTEPLSPPAKSDLIYM